MTGDGPDLAGREADVERVRDALNADDATLVLLVAAPGVGASAVAERAAGGLDGAVVLRADARRARAEPFGALAAIGPQLAARLEERGVDPDPRGGAVFPALGVDEVSWRRTAFKGVAESLARAAGDGRVVLLVDGLDAVDADSAALLLHLRLRPPAGLVVLGTVHAAGDLGEQASATIELAPLPHAMIRALAAAEGDLDDEALDAVVEAAAGRPARLGPLLAARAADRPLDLSAIAAHVVEAAAEALAELLAGGDGDADALEPGLDARLLVRGPDGAIQEASTEARRALEGALPEEARREACARLAERGIDADGPPQRLVAPLLAAGREAEAAAFALEAGAGAEARHAYHAAADLYLIAHANGPAVDATRTLETLAEALERAGRHEDAAARWDELAEAREGEEAAAARARAARALLAGGPWREGIGRLDAELAALGEPEVGRSGGLGAALTGLGFLFGPPGRVRVRAEGDGEPRPAVIRAEREVRLALMVGLLDPRVGVSVLRGARRTFAQHGALAQAAWCDFLFAAFAESSSDARSRPRVVDRYRTSGERLYRDHDLSTPRLEAARSYLDGFEALRETQWDDALAAFERALARLEAAGERETFEYSYALSQIGLTNTLRQDFAGASETLERCRAFARGRGGGAVRLRIAHLESVQAWAAGRFAEASERMIALREALPDDRSTTAAAVAGLYAGAAAVYAEDPLATLTGAVREEAERFDLFTRNTGGYFSSVVALGEAAALRAGVSRASARRARAFARRAQRAAPVARGDAERALAYVADAAGHDGEAVLLLQQAEELAREADRPLAAAIAQHQRGLRLPRRAGQLLRAHAREIVDALGVAPALLDEDPAHRGG